MSKPTRKNLAVRTIDSLTAAELTELEAEITKQFLPAKGDGNGNVLEPGYEFITSDGTRFNQQFYNQALDHEIRTENKTRIRQALNQKRLPDWVYYLGLNQDVIRDERVKNIKFNGAYRVTIEDANDPFYIPALYYMFPMLKFENINLYRTMERLGNGIYVIIHTSIEGRDERESAEIMIRKMDDLKQKAQQIIYELDNPTDDGELEK